MPTSSNYEADLPSAAPQYLRDWAEERQWKNQALIWRVGYYREPTTGMKRKCAEAICTACGNGMLLDYVPGGSCHGAGYGPRLFIGCKQVDNWSDTYCPECGEKVRSEQISGATVYAGECSYPMTLHRICAEGQTDRLAMVFWKVDKRHSKDGKRTICITPWEGYVVEEKKIIRLNHHGSCMGESYNLGYWRQTAECRDTIRDILWTVCPGGIAAATAGTTAENSKLERYMENGRICFPVSWVRIWQKHANAENLLTCGAGDIVSNLIGQEKRKSARGYQETYGTAIPKLACIRWKENRPGRMLGMDRGELREAIALQKQKNLGGGAWELWLHARASGHAWTLEDVAALEQLDRKDRFRDCPERPARIAHYLDVQRRRWKEDEPDDGMLLDYWDMLRHAKPGLKTADDIWPERLKREHDRLIQEKKHEENRALDAMIAARAEKLDRAEYHYGGLFITPPRSSGDFEIEEKTLHHCVAGYAKRHAEGKTTILFIRKEAEPKTPYFTLEWSETERRVVQNRGNRNCDRTPEVREYEKSWVAWMQMGCPKMEVKSA